MFEIMQGVRVVEIGSFVFVPLATAVLADWGADVIKPEGRAPTNTAALDGAADWARGGGAVGPLVTTFRWRDPPEFAPDADPDGPSPPSPASGSSRH
jgi:crotonobetainyl-CoA:carnitine CoA-transferase CaiB-like acyl-CoA transferase